MKSEPKETDITEIIHLISLMPEEDRLRAIRDLHSYESICIKKTYSKDGELVKVSYQPPQFVEFYPKEKP